MKATYMLIENNVDVIVNKDETLFNSNNLPIIEVRDQYKHYHGSFIVEVFISNQSNFELTQKAPCRKSRKKLTLACVSV